MRTLLVSLLLVCSAVSVLGLRKSSIKTAKVVGQDGTVHLSSALVGVDDQVTDGIAWSDYTFGDRNGLPLTFIRFWAADGKLTGIQSAFGHGTPVWAPARGKAVGTPLVVNVDPDGFGNRYIVRIEGILGTGSLTHWMQLTFNDGSTWSPTGVTKPAAEIQEHEIYPGLYRCAFFEGIENADGFRWRESKFIPASMICAVNNGGCDAANSHCLAAKDGNSRTCVCKQGYTPGSATHCVNINECATENGGCDKDADCIDTPGSFWCQCRTGFIPTGSTCTDINECATNNGGCDPVSTECFNTAGGRKCDCKPGFYLAGLKDYKETVCHDTNECASNNGACDKNARCENLPGTRRCICNSGFTSQPTYENGLVNRNNPICNDIDECSKDNGGCGNGDCRNTAGSRECFCKRGWVPGLPTPWLNGLYNCDRLICVSEPALNAVCEKHHVEHYHVEVLIKTAESYTIVRQGEFSSVKEVAELPSPPYTIPALPPAASWV